MHNFIESPICMRPERLSNPKHPAQKPVAILKKMIEIASNKDDIIFDPFMGVGSTGVAALDLNRRFIGVELDVSYFNAAKKRIDAALQVKNLSQQVLKTKAYKLIESEQSSIVCDVSNPYQTALFDLDKFFDA